ncbi:hypothetical protein A3D00_02900 [Candidatus Woesebacteria bacterium RIFCSPHIGHO2_02_FULL_38_9]|nr:MAG: hypothetical protein A3D00_02900 [Candidatus Woesebacteria bacterium RIFCSPHIGHO2_02_FULL_38_9]
MKIIFFGTPEYVLPIVEAINKKYNSGREKNFVCVVTQPPAKVGREKRILHSPVDNWAYRHKIKIITDLKKENLPEADLGILAAYGEIIPDFVINHFKFGILNIHPSPFPEFRGASPVQAALITGTNPTGVTVIKLTQKLDSGPIISSFKEEVFVDDTTQTLRKRLFERSSEFLINLPRGKAGLIPNYLNGKIKPKSQDESKTTFTKLIKKEDGFIPPKYLEAALRDKRLRENWEIRFIKDFSIKYSVLNIERFIRAMYPWPVAWSFVKNQKRLKILKAHIDDKRLILDSVQLEGKNPTSWEEFKRGYPNVSFAN